MSARNVRKRKKDRWGIALIGTLILVAGAGSATYYTQAKHHVKLDEHGCRSDVLYDHVVLLVDRSDPLTAVQKLDVRQRVDKVVQSAAVGTRFSLNLLNTSNVSLVSTVFDGCRPDDGRAVNHLTQNERQIRARWRDAFLGPLHESLEDTLADEPSDTSPILEGIQLAALTSFQPTQPTGTQKRLLIISDMIHNNGGYSQYADSLNYEYFAGLGYSRTVAAPLSSVDVEIYYVGRKGRERIQTSTHRLFWEAWIRSGGGRMTLFDPLIGG